MNVRSRPALFILLGGAISGFTESLHRLVERERKSTEQAEQHAAELTRTQQERDALLAEAQELNRVKDEFLATLSHELRTPINAVLGWTQMLRAGMVQGDRVAAALETIERNAAAQQRLIEDLLDVSRIITGQFRMESLPVDLATVVRTSVQGVEPAALAKNIRITMAVAGEPIALGDPTRLQQAVWNLLSNAVKFTDHDGQVDVTVAAAGPSVEITVRDSGIGIAPEVLPRIFERFTQADGGTTRAHSGLGLGLAIVRHIVELHGGTVSGASEGAGRGAIFRIVVPAAVRIAADATPMSARDQTAADEAQMQRR